MKKSNFIKLISLFLIFTMSFVTFADMTVPDFNGVGPQNHIYKYYTNERKEELKKNEISFDNIADMVHLYNPDVLSNWNEWENNKSANDMADIYQDAADRAFDASASLDSGNEVMDNMQEGMLRAQADGYQIQADKSADDSYTRFLNYYMAEKKLVLNTKLLDIQYFQSDYVLKSAEATVEEAKRKEETALNAFQCGNGTNIDYLNAKKNTMDAESALVKARTNQNASKRNLLINCGKSMNDNVNVKPINLYYVDKIAKMNLETDYETAMKNNIQFEIYKKRKENARTTEVKNEYDILINAAPQKIYTALDSAYSDVVSTCDTYSNRDVALKIANDSLAKAVNEFANGNISAKEFKTAEYNVVIAECNLESAKYDMAAAYEKYAAYVDGLVSC